MNDLFRHEHHSEWGQKLEAAGVKNVRAMIATATMMQAGADLAIGGEHIPVNFVREWLKWHDDRQTASMPPNGSEPKS